MIIVVMGVCGSGKTTVGTLVAEKINCSFADADQFHSEANKDKMANGLPLTDQDRIPWLLSIHDFIMSKNKDGKSVVVTCSALKHSYRDKLRNGQEIDKNALDKSLDKVIHNKYVRDSAKIETRFEAEISKTNNFKTYLKGDHSNGDEMVPIFIHLTGSMEVLQDRLLNRKGHFMPKSLLRSQLDTLEELGADEVGFSVDIAKRIDDIVNEILSKLGI